MLFRVGDWPERWFVTGFAVFLSGLVGYGASWQYRWALGDDGPASRSFVRGLVTDPALLFLMGWLAVFGLAVYVALLWVSSRAKFVFLENVAALRPAIGDPWKGYAREGNSLFVFRLVFVLITFSITILVVGPPLVLGGIASVRGGNWGWGLGGAFLSVLAGMILGIAIAYAYCFLDNFVVPLMYRDRSSAMDAWRKFLPLLRERPAEFLLFGVLLLVLAVAAGIAVFVAGVLTCCIGLFVLAIPYVGTVALMPLWTTYRGYGPEFLAQFGPEWTVFPPEVVEPGPTPGTATGPPPSDAGGTPPEGPQTSPPGP
jgi:hypothetical protein